MTPSQEERQFLKDLDRRLWTAADQLRANLDASAYKHTVLGLVFLKYVSDAFKERRDELAEQFHDPEHEYFLGITRNAERDEAEFAAELEVRDYYTEKNVFWVPARARWDWVREHIKTTPNTELALPGAAPGDKPYLFKSRGKLIDDAMAAIEQDNPKLKNVLNKDYARLQLDDDRLGRLVDLIADIPFQHASLGAKDILGHVYEFFLGEFALAEGKKGGQYHTPKAIVGLIVEMLEPYRGRVYDPCCGSGGFFVQSERFIEEHTDLTKYTASQLEARKRQIAVYGQESNPTTWRLACMNLAIRGIDYNLGKEPADTFTRDQHPTLLADFIMANPPFNMREWGADELADDPRWRYGAPPAANANFAWMQHMLHHLAPGGRMALLLSNGSMSSTTNTEGDIRQRLLEEDFVEALVALPGQLFTNTQIPACIWVLSRAKAPHRRKQVLFVDARQRGFMVDRVLRDFADADIAALAETYHQWQQPGGTYADVPGYCYSAALAEIAKHDFVLTPGRYVGAEEKEATGEPFEVVMPKLAATLREQFKEGARLQQVIAENLAGLGV